MKYFSIDREKFKRVSMLGELELGMYCYIIYLMEHGLGQFEITKIMKDRSKADFERYKSIREFIFPL